MMHYALGKIRGLQTTANSAGIFTILALDHGASFMSGELPRYEDMSAMKSDLIHALAPYASAVLLDPIYGLAPAVFSGALPGGVGLLLAVEDGDYKDPAGGHQGRLLESWSVAKIKRAGAAAVKLFFYYNPNAGEIAQDQEELVREVARDCQHYDLPLFAEPLTYGVEAADRRSVVLETARRISRLDIDVLKIEFPIDVHSESSEAVWQVACEELSVACRVPWALLSAGVDFETFVRQVQIACQAGASGYLAGRAIWGETVGLQGEEREAHLEEITIPRMQTLAEIATAHGRPWTKFYPNLNHLPPKGWFRRYEGG